MDQKKRLQTIILIVLVLGALGIAIPRLVSKPAGERLKIKELESKATQKPEAGTPEADARDMGAVGSPGGEALEVGKKPVARSDHTIGRNPFRELARSNAPEPPQANAETERPLSGGSMGSGPLWPSQSAKLEPFPGALPGFGTESGGGQTPPRELGYTVTGIVSGDNSVAVLRTTESRIYVRPGQVLQDGSRVASVYRDRVVLNRADGQQILVLGGSKSDGSSQKDAGQS